MLVQCHGHFDLLHFGHLKHLKFARSLGSKLIVTVTSDEFITKPGHPVFTSLQRIEMLKALRVVDDAYAIHAADAIPALAFVKPDIYVKGKEYEGNLVEQDYCDKHGIKVVFSDEIVFSSTKLLNGQG